MAAADAAITAATLPGAHTARDAMGGAVTIAGQLSDAVGTALLGLARAAFVTGFRLTSAGHVEAGEPVVEAASRGPPRSPGACPADGNPPHRTHRTYRRAGRPLLAGHPVWWWTRPAGPRTAADRSLFALDALPHPVVPQGLDPARPYP
jgi:hypothetical protein